MSWKTSPRALSQPSPVRRPRVRTRRWRLPVGRVMLLALLAGAAIEALLAIRLWAQLTGQTIDSGALLLIFDATNVLVSPFKEYEPSSPIKVTGILEIATLIAVQAYFIATFAVLVLLWLAGAVLNFWLRPVAQEPMSEPAATEAALEPAGPLNEALPSS